MDKLISPAYAATNGEKMWKSYGNRYFTAKITVSVGVGIGTCCLENHYKLNSKGIDENFGDAYVKWSASTGITGSLSPIGVYITDSTNKKIKVQHSWK